MDSKSSTTSDVTPLTNQKTQSGGLNETGCCSAHSIICVANASKDLVPRSKTNNRFIIYQRLHCQSTDGALSQDSSLSLQSTNRKSLSHSPLIHMEPLRETISTSSLSFLRSFFLSGALAWLFLLLSCSSSSRSSALSFALWQ